MAEPFVGERRTAGKSVKRRDLYEKVTGAATYTVDVFPPGCLHAKVVRSTRAHARITAIDKSAALATPGVVAVITSDDLDGLFPRFGHIVPDHCILAIGKVRYYGGMPQMVAHQNHRMIHRLLIPHTIRNVDLRRNDATFKVR